MSDLILVLDDELSYATMVSDLLEQNGYQTEVCTRPREALDRLHQRSYGLIVTDFKMPEVDGAELLLEVRKILPNTPVIMISGLMGKPDLIKVANIGVTLVLEKPLNAPLFLEYVARFVQPSEAPAVGGMAGVKAGGEGEKGNRYPQPLRHVVGESELMRSFLQGFWERLDQFSHSLLVIPPGGEFEPLMREAAEWLELGRSTICRLTSPELDRAEVRAALVARAQDDAAMPLIAVGTPEHVEIDLERLDRFIRWTQENELVRARLRFVHALPDVLEARQFSPAPDLSEVVSKPLVLPPLRERLVDLGGWIRRLSDLMESERRRPIGAEAVALLLQYPWPGNHFELLSTVRRATALARRGEITDAVVRLALRDRHGEPLPEGTALDLRAFLLGEQRRFLQQHLPKNNWFEALTRLVGGKFERLRADKEVDEQPLLFDELATLGPSA